MPDEPIGDGAGTQQQLEGVVKSLHELTETLKKERADRVKDTWDKFNALSPFVTGLIVAIVGGVFTLSEGHRNELLKRQERADADRQAAQETLTKEHQARVLELQTIAQFMPYLTSKNEDSKEAAITAIKALSSASLAIELASLNKSPGTVRAVRQIATQSTNESDRKLAQAALVELEKPTEGPNKTLLKTELGDCGPEGSGGDKPTNLLKNRTDVPPKFADRTIEELEHLQIADVPVRRDAWTSEQAAGVKSLGDGQPIRVQGYLVAAHREGGTTANCAFRSYVDWHLVVGPSPEISPKDGLIAVVGPRIRVSHPTWSLAQLRQLAVSKVPVRVSGWQFFDQQHLQQDRSDTRRFRATPWEVRPVLKIEVLKDQSWFDLDNTSLQSANNLAKPQQ
jgi:hypothetical protein